MAHAAASQPLSFAAARAPKKPVLPLPTEEELAEDAVATAPGHDADYAQPSAFEEEPYTPQLPETYDPGEPEGDEEDLVEPAHDAEFGRAEDDGYASLAGARIERDPEAATEGEWAEEGGEGEDALELTLEAGEDAGEPAQDELLLDESRTAEAEEPVQPMLGRRRRLLGGDDGESEETPPPQRRAPTAPPAGGSTLFERMANLSRANAAH